MFRNYDNMDDWWDAVGKEKWRELEREKAAERAADAARAAQEERDRANPEHDKGV